MKTLGITIFIIMLVYLIINYKLYDFNKRETIYSVEYRPIPYTALDMINENNIESKVNTFDSSIYSQVYEAVEPE